MGAIAYPMATPRPAAPEIPMRCASTTGVRWIPWSAAPELARAAPVATAASVLGRRTPDRTRPDNDPSGDRPAIHERTSDMEMSTAPSDSDAPMATMRSSDAEVNHRIARLVVVPVKASHRGIQDPS
jgi:hypothetical protein